MRMNTEKVCLNGLQWLSPTKHFFGSGKLKSKKTSKVASGIEFKAILEKIARELSQQCTQCVGRPRGHLTNLVSPARCWGLRGHPRLL